MNHVVLSLCCNDHRNGAFVGLCRQIDVHGILNLSSPWVDSSLRLHIGERDFRLGKTRTWPHHGHREWVGNWCWDSVLVSLATTASVLTFAIVEKGYQPDSGFEKLFDKAANKQPITVEDLVAEGLGARP